MKNLRSLVLAGLALVLIAGAAAAIQPGTSGTAKQFQQQGLRIGVPVMVNNTATASAGAATCSPCAAGVITTEALTTAAGTEYTLTLTNSLIAVGDVVIATVANGTSNAGNPGVTLVQPAAGSVLIKVRNGHATVALNGTLLIGFVVIKQSALNAD